MSSMSAYGSLVSPHSSSWSFVADLVPHYWSSVLNIAGSAFAMAVGVILFRFLLSAFRSWVQ